MWLRRTRQKREENGTKSSFFRVPFPPFSRRSEVLPPVPFAKTGKMGISATHRHPPPQRLVRMLDHRTGSELPSTSHRNDHFASAPPPPRPPVPCHSPDAAGVASMQSPQHYPRPPPGPASASLHLPRTCTTVTPTRVSCTPNSVAKNFSMR